MRRRTDDPAQTLLFLQAAINEVQKTGQSPNQVLLRRRHRSVADRRRTAFIAFCRRRDQWGEFKGNWVVPDEKGTVVASALNEESARAAGATALSWQRRSVVVIPFCVEDSAAELAAEALTAEFGDS